MLLIAGVVPFENFPLTFGTIKQEGEFLTVDGRSFPRTQGTGAMIGAALAVTKYLNIENPCVVLAGDMGQGQGSFEVYEYLIENLEKIPADVLALHYWLPNMALTRELCKTVGKLKKKPLMIADASSMYSAKAAGMAEDFDIFTPDASEMAFLADPNATHPAYIDHHLFNADISRTPELIRTAYANHDASHHLVVKGKTDYIIHEGEIVATTEEPDIPELEAIGGTGDTITGQIAAFTFAGLEPDEAGIIATRANRAAGKAAEVTPATRVAAIIDKFPEIYKENLCEWSGVCSMKGDEKND